MKKDLFGTKNETAYHFKVGDFTCIIVNDGYATFPTKDLFTGLSECEIEKAICQYGIGKYVTEISFLCLYVDTGEHKIIIDTGFGKDYVQTSGNLVENLKQNGINPEDIDIVILSHAHEDHCGGNVDAECKPNFPNAKYIISRKELDYCTSDDMLSDNCYANFIEKYIMSLKDKLCIIDKDEEIYPGIKLLLTPGHTPGLLAVQISSNGESLFCVTDNISHPIYIENPECYMNYDEDVKKAIETRKKIMSMIVDNNMLTFAYHFDFPGLGYIKRDKERYFLKKI
ncbi:N-acyl homoserine lactonase [Clostridium tepidiprofundi DSM 19306]|uniref:N-acyl homoserine lactonase n=1 Tax=Clostridium tepidiprofundi DSM 19306 TaxID=1121338 RepID=A0A151B6J6_9CLOT|nr:MBL fold metallo-hydrolase [Clostridium tepidiprofundi]KYH35526.1 N-acyl homoserine lactonase [Clostridium tepidiprofundi DSM 19306]